MIYLSYESIEIYSYNSRLTLVIHFIINEITVYENIKGWRRLVRQRYGFQFYDTLVQCLENHDLMNSTQFLIFTAI